MNLNYYFGRKRRIDYRYRLNKRTNEVIQVIKKYYNKPINKILDLGTADGLMLGKIKDHYPNTKCIGIEYSKELIDANKDKRIKIIQGDVQNISLSDNVFDIVIATAIIEHINNPDKLISEAYRVLKPNGLLILTTPVPFFEKISDLIGGIPKEVHQLTFNLVTLKKLLNKFGFKISLSKKFMLTPIGFPFENFIENFLNKIKLDLLLLNQLIVGEK